MVLEQVSAPAKQVLPCIGTDWDLKQICWLVLLHYTEGKWFVSMDSRMPGFCSRAKHPAVLPVSHSFLQMPNAEQ